MPQTCCMAMNYQQHYCHPSQLDVYAGTKAVLIGRLKEYYGQDAKESGASKAEPVTASAEPLPSRPKKAQTRKVSLGQASKDEAAETSSGSRDQDSAGFR